MYRGNSWDIMWDYNGTWYIYHGIIYVYIYTYTYIIYHMGNAQRRILVFLVGGLGVVDCLRVVFVSQVSNGVVAAVFGESEKR